jgi:hypothetical protein
MRGLGKIASRREPADQKILVFAQLLHIGKARPQARKIDRLVDLYRPS